MNQILISIRKDPFRIFFPIAILIACYASFLWIEFALITEENIPVTVHARLFIGGFIYLAIIGFLKTAITGIHYGKEIKKKESLNVDYFYNLSENSGVSKTNRIFFSARLRILLLKVEEQAEPPQLALIILAPAAIA